MALDATASEYGFRKSITKFFVDNLYQSQGKLVTFDVGLLIPKLQGSDATEWFAVQQGTTIPDAISMSYLDIYCCTRHDENGENLAQLIDILRDLCTDSTQLDGAKRIPYYDVSDLDNWVQVGTLLCQEIREDRYGMADDGTKFKMFTLILKWAAKI